MERSRRASPPPPLLSLSPRRGVNRPSSRSSIRKEEAWRRRRPGCGSSSIARDVAIGAIALRALPYQVPQAPPARAGIAGGLAVQTGAALHTSNGLHCTELIRSGDEGVLIRTLELALEHVYS